MYEIKLFVIKFLKRLKLLKYCNFHLNKTINGIDVKIPFINGIGISNFVLYSDWLDSLISQFTKKGIIVFVDVGVNIGQTTIRVKTLLPETEYIGFEPNSTCASYMKQLIKSNNFSKCLVYNFALSSSLKIQELEKTLIDDVRASAIPSLRPGFFEDKDPILAVDYDSLFFDRNVSFIKIDVEGAELDVIKGMQQSINKYQPIIVCEVLDCHHSSVFEFTQSRAIELSRLLLSLNYSIIQLGTSRVKNKVISFKIIQTIQIKQWTNNSYDSNDYLFYPTATEQDVLMNLSEICHK